MSWFKLLSASLCLNLIFVVPAWGLSPSPDEVRRSLPAPKLPDFTIPAAKTFELNRNADSQSLVDLFTGSSQVQLPVNVPPSVNELVPRLDVTYSSHQVEIPTLFGHGWNLQLPRIERRQVSGQSTLYSQDHFRIAMPELQDDLVLLTDTETQQTFGLTRERNFPRIVRNLANNSWTLVTTQGITHTFGTTNDTREQSADGSKTFAWAIVASEDLQGNRIDYQYTKIGNILYPRTVRYGAQTEEGHPFEVRFSPFGANNPVPNRTQPRYDYSAGFLRHYQHQLDAIDVVVQDDVRMSYEFDYSQQTPTDRSELAAFRAVPAPIFETPPQEIRFDYYQTNDDPGHSLRLLKRVTYPLGAEAHISYVTANTLTEYGSLVNKRPHTPIVVVKEVVWSDFTGRNDRTSYGYRNGHYFFESALQRQLAGFGDVSVTDPLGHVTEYSFLQGRGLPEQLLRPQDNRALIGVPYRTIRRDAVSGEAKIEQQRWRAAPLGEERWFVHADLTVTTVDDGEATRNVATEHVYGPMYGLLHEEIDYGFVDLTDIGFSDLDPADNRRRVTEYAHNTQEHIHAFPSSKILYSSDGMPVNRTQYQYDNLPLGSINSGNNTQIHRWLKEEDRNLTTTFTHSPNGRIATIQTPRNGIYNIAYESLGLYPTAITNPLQHQSQYEYDLFTGQLISTTDPNGFARQQSLDGFGRWVAQEETNVDGVVALRQYRLFEELQLPQSVKSVIMLDSNEVSTIVYRDGFGRTIQKREEKEGSNNFAVTQQEYDALGRPASNTLAVGRPTSGYTPLPGSLQRTTTRYDAFGRQTLIEDANGATKIAFGEAGTKKTVTDPNANDVDFYYDGLGRLWKVAEHNEGDVYETYYQYDSRDLITRIEDAEGFERAFEYDSLERVNSFEDLHAPTTSSPATWAYGYDDDGNIIATLDPRGNTSTAEYDLLNRLKQRLYTDGSGPILHTYRYDFGANGIGRLNAVQTPHSVQAFRYDKRGRVSQETHNIGDNHSYSKTTQYTSFDEPKTISYSNGVTVAYNYDSAGQLETIAVNDSPVVESIQYAPDSRIETIDYHNDVSSEFTYDPLQMNRLASKQTWISDDYLQDLIYSYDPTGNIAQLEEQAPTQLNRRMVYTYDDLNRLQSSTRNLEPTIAYEYSPTGNIVSMGNNAYTYWASSNRHPQAVQAVDNTLYSTSFDYDLAGNLITRSNPSGVFTFSWNAANRLSDVSGTDSGAPTTARYTYDAEGRRITKELEDYVMLCGSGPGPSVDYCTTELSHSELNHYPFEEYQRLHAGEHRVAIYADNEHVATAVSLEEPCGTSSVDLVGCFDTYVVYHHDDHLAGSSVVTNESGDVIELLDYEPFGTISRHVKATNYDATQKFTGHELDVETNLYYAKARYYDANNGRFTAVDPLQRQPLELFRQFSEKPQGLNAYSYALNNPLVLVDPTGEVAVAAPLLPYAAAGVVGVAAGFYQLRDNVDDVANAIGSIATDTANSIRSTLSPKGPNQQEQKLPPPVTSRDTHEKLRKNIENKVKNDHRKFSPGQSRIGDGSTSDAVRHERRTGVPVGGSNFHYEKAYKSLRGFRNNVKQFKPQTFGDNLLLRRTFKTMRNLHNSLRRFDPR